MKVTIWKYPLKLVDGQQAVRLPAMNTLRHVGLQYGVPTLWFEVVSREDAIGATRYFTVIGTGDPVPPRHRWQGTAVGPTLVWHVYEALRGE